MSEKPANPEVVYPFMIRDVDFQPAGFPREFTQAELGVYHEVAGKHEYRRLKREYESLVKSRTMHSVDASIKAAQKRVQALEDRLDALSREMAANPDTWDDEKLEAVEERLATEVERLKTLVEPQLEQGIEGSYEYEDKTNEILGALDQIEMRIAHAIGKHHKLPVGKITDWLLDPPNADLDNAATLVEVGVTSIPLNRAQRRMLKKHSSGAYSTSAQ